MGTTREEVITTLGVDSSSIERGLGIGKNYFQDYLNFQKTEEGKYSNWWNTELKKREEMEIASSVRAASRSIQARRLLRERETVQQERANQEMAQGSGGYGWLSKAAGAGGVAGAATIATKGEKAAQALAKLEGEATLSTGAVRELGVMLREGINHNWTRLASSTLRFGSLLSLGATALTGFVAVAAEAGAILYEVYQTRKAVKEEEESQARNKTGAGIMADRLKTEVSNFEKVGKISHETAAKYEKILSSPTLERNRVVQDALRKLGGPVTKHDVEAEARADEEHNKNLQRNAREDMNAEERTIMSGYKVIQLKADMAKLDHTGIEYKKKQLELDEAQRDLLHDQKDLAKEKGEAQRKANEEQEVYDQAKLRMTDIEQREREKFMPTLEELAHHGRFGSQARGIGRLERRIKRDFERGDTGAADRDIGDRNKIYDSLADRGVVAERSDRREIKELTAKMHLHIEAIAKGTAVVKTQMALNH